MFMTSFWDHLYQYAQEHLVVRYLQEEPTGYGRLSIQTDARRRGLEDLLRGPAARSFRRLGELYATTGQVGFLASQRVDGKLILPEAVKVLQQKAA